ncbi:hypothetical protein GGI02_001330 [Coemansia sp. RSA 2322]|nr:hypothetical protein GGI02_001330 [Coemansia sp. RSA 2322]
MAMGQHGRGAKRRPRQRREAAGVGGGAGEPAATYRDRAAERRQGERGEYGESELLLRHLSSEGMSAYEQSKFLGGDVAHTHLVKGLDFLLLRKVREEGSASDAGRWDAEIERLGATGASSDYPAEDEDWGAATEAGRRLAAAVRRIRQARRDVQSGGAAAASDLFAPGRMFFEITYGSGGGSVRAVARVRSLDEVQAAAGQRGLLPPAAVGAASDRVVLAKVAAAIASSRRRRAAVQQYVAAEPSRHLPPSPPRLSEPDRDDEDDIFADAGVDYLAAVHAEPAPRHVDEIRSESGDEGVTAPYPESDSEGVTAPYPESDNEQVTAPYPESDNEQATAPYPESDNEQVAAPYPESDNEQVTAPYPESDNELADPDSLPRQTNLPHDLISGYDETDAALFSMARSRHSVY